MLLMLVSGGGPGLRLLVFVWGAEYPARYLPHGVIFRDVAGWVGGIRSSYSGGGGGNGGCGGGGGSGGGRSGGGGDESSGQCVAGSGERVWPRYL